MIGDRILNKYIISKAVYIFSSLHSWPAKKKHWNYLSQPIVLKNVYE